MICGTPEEVIEQVASLTDLFDPGLRYIARLYYPGTDLQVMRESPGSSLNAWLPRCEPDRIGARRPHRPAWSQNASPG